MAIICKILMPNQKLKYWKLGFNDLFNVFCFKKNWVAIILPTIAITNWLNTHRRHKEEEGKMHLKNLKPPLYYKKKDVGLTMIWDNIDYLLFHIRMLLLSLVEV